MSLFVKDKKILWIPLLVTNIAALWEGIIDYKAAICLFSLFLVSIGYFRANFPRFIKFILFIIIIAFALGAGFHMIPGFYNLLVINKLQLSQESYPFSIYLNFDKVMAALIIFSSSNIPNILPNLKSIKLTLFSLLICMIFISLIAIMSGYVKFEPKFPEILCIWALNNLLFVCFSEEVLFRGFFQNQLNALIKSPIISICITALIFGVAHFHGGLLYIGLSIICGFFYSYTYYRTGSLICSMLVHFGVNFSHFLLFTYPALMPN